MSLTLRNSFAALAALAVLGSASAAQASSPRILGDSFCGDDGKAYAAWDVETFSVWGVWGENPDIRVDLSVDNGPWVEVDQGEFFAPEWGFSGSTALPDGSLSFRLRAWSAGVWGDGVYNPEPRYADLSWQGDKYATDFPVPTDCAPTASPGTGTPGYWKNHPDAWPGGIELGGFYYTIEQGIDLLSTPTAGDVTNTMSRHLIAAVLNVEIGNDASCIDAVIDDAQAWIAAYPPGSKVKAKSDAWQLSGEAIATTLDLYNNGELCVSHRD